MLQKSVVKKIRSANSEDEFAAPLRVHIKVKTPKVSKPVVAPAPSRFEPPVAAKPEAKLNVKSYIKAAQENNDDRWILHNTATTETLLQCLGPYQYNSIEQRKNPVKTRQKSPPNVKLMPTCTSSPKQSGNRSNSADSNTHLENGIPSVKNPYTMMQGNDHLLFFKILKSEIDGFGSNLATCTLPLLSKILTPYNYPLSVKLDIDS